MSVSRDIAGIRSTKAHTISLLQSMPVRKTIAEKMELFHNIAINKVFETSFDGKECRTEKLIQQKLDISILIHAKEIGWLTYGRS